MTNFTATRPWRFGFVAQAVLVAETEATEVLANDALDDLRREATVDLRRALTERRALGLVRAAEAAVAVAEALTGAGAGAVSERSDVAEADAFAATAAAFADAGEAEAARAERVADRVAPHVAAGARADRCRATLRVPTAPSGRSDRRPRRR